MAKTRVYLFQPQYAVDDVTYWIPYSIGCVWSYAAQFPDIQDGFELADIIFKREHPDQVLACMQDPGVCAFSCYIWNERYSLELARRIKARWPNCLTVFGGPQVNGRLIKHDYIDSIIMAEGEENFLAALRRLKSGAEPVLLYEKRRLEQLDVPSPYTTGVFDKIIADNPEIMWSMTFETNRGCPYHCTFCDWGSLTYSKVKKFNIEHVRADLEWSIGKPINYVYCADANFGIFKERDLEIAKIIREIGDRTNWDTVNLIYAKNSTEVVFQIAKTLGDLNRGITVSVQSQNEDTLEAIKRKNLATNDIRHLMDLSEQYGVPTYTEVILGLPHETMASWKQGLAEILELGQHNSIDLWFTQLIENSELNSAESRSRYGIKTVVAKDYMPLYNPRDYREIAEEFELINATNTMTTAEMIECYMYGWMIIQFHCTGYSQILARHARSQGISYHDYYSRFFSTLQQDDFFADHFAEIESVVTRYLTAGQATVNRNNKGGHNIHALSYDFLYQHRQQAYRLASEVTQGFGLKDQDVVQVQENFIYEEHKTYPMRVGSYVIESRITGAFDFYKNRRQGLFKNKVTKT